MPRAKLVKCKGCGRRFKKSELSKAGYCKDCRLDHMIKVITQLKEKRGYYYRKWRKAWLKARRKHKKAIKQLKEKRGPIYEKWLRGMLTPIRPYVGMEKMREMYGLHSAR